MRDGSWSHRAVAAAAAALVAGGIAAAGEQPFEVRRVNLIAELGRELPENTLKLFWAAVDPAARRLYVSGILTPHLAVMDLDTRRWIATIDSGLPRGYTYLYAEPQRRLLFVHASSTGRLLRVDPEAGAVGPEARVPSSSGTVVCDGGRGLVYLATPEAPTLRAFREDTLELAWSSDAVSPGAGQPVLEPGSGDLYLLDLARTGPEGRIERFDPDTRTVVGTVTFELPAGQRARRLLLDPVGHRLVVGVGADEVRTLAMDGTALGSYRVPAGLELERMELDATRGRLLLVTLERPEGDLVAGVGGHLLVVDLDTLSLERDIPVGRKPRAIAIDPTTGVAWLPNGDASTVWAVDPGTGEVTGYRLGDSAEELVALEGGRRLVTESRLGGSYLMAWDTARRELETFTTGTWPVPVRAVPGLGLLVVLNAWDGTLSVLAEDDLRHPLATIPLDLPPGTTDRLPGLAVDPVRELAFAAYPEHGAIAVADLAALAADGVLAVPGAETGEGEGGPGQLLVAADPAADRLLAVEPLRGRVTVFSIDARSVVATAAFDPDRAGSPATDMLFADTGRHTCWVGRIELATLDGAPTGRELPRGDRVFALDPGRGVYWVAGVEGGEDVLAAVDRETLAVAGAWPLGAADPVHSAFVFVPPNRIWRARMAEVDLTAYDLREGSRRPAGRATPAAPARPVSP